MPSQVASRLLRSARSFAGQLTTIAKGYAPNHLKKGISSKAQEIEEGVIKITITAKGADAAAQEYGSGIHGKKHKKYPIVGKPWLAFMPTNGYKGNAYGAYDPNTRKGVGEKTYFITDKVIHPGIEKYQGKGYIAPAVREWRKTLRKKLAPEMYAAITGELNKAFKTGVKK